jgi:4,5:9,10-diseco-3-hydroxy-5,9,17-trioxoandrosta-1(10),2-diene-4-oate hydrolase
MNTKAVPEGKYADVGDGLRVHYQELGEGPPLVFLHGSGPGASGFSNFKRNYPYFAERGFRTLAPDTLGFGYSSQPKDIDYGLDFLVGKLVLMAPGGLEERETYMKMEGIRTMMSIFLSKEGITRDGMRKVFGLQLFDQSLLTDEIIEERFQIAEHQPKRVLTSLNVPHLTPRLGELACPVFALWGMNDKFCPVSGAMRIAESCKRSRVMLLSECGHWVMVEHTDLFNRLCLDFLREQ